MSRIHGILILIKILRVRVEYEGRIYSQMLIVIQEKSDNFEWRQ